MREGRDKTLGHGIAEARHDDRDRFGRLLNGLERRRRVDDYNVNSQTDKLGSEVGKPALCAVYASALEGDVAALDVAQLVETLTERLPKQRIADEPTDSGNSARLLRPAGK